MYVCRYQLQVFFDQKSVQINVNSYVYKYITESCDIVKKGIIAESLRSVL